MKAAVICSQGIGDGLLMMVASHRLFSNGYDVTTFHNSLNELSRWFPNHKFQKKSSLHPIEEILSSYDLIVLQNDNSDLAFSIITLYKQGRLHNLSVFYASYSSTRHLSLTSWDRVFNLSRPMVDNIAEAIASVLQSKQISKNNGIVPPNEYSYKKNPKRILIHPTTTYSKKTWDPKKFLTTARFLRKEGYEVAFCIHPSEQEEWKSRTLGEFPLPLFPTLADLSSYIYESGYIIGNDSGPGHLASNLQIPSLIIAGCYKQMALWRPGWFAGGVVLPPSWIPNVKGFRLRKNKWQHFISSRRVLSHFHTLVKINQISIN